MLKAVLIKLYNLMIPRKAGKFSLPRLERHTGESQYFLSFELR